MRCWHCQYKIKNPGEYCPRCGRRLAGPVSENTNIKRVFNKMNPSDKEKDDKDTREKMVLPGNSGGTESRNNKKVLLAGGIAIILVVAASTAVIAMTRRTDKQNDKEQSKAASTIEMAQETAQYPSEVPLEEESATAEKEKPEEIDTEKEEPEEIDTRRSVDDVFRPDGSFFTYDGHTYCFYDVYTINENEYGNVTDADAGAYKNVQKFCRDQEGHLAIIDSIAENEVLFDETQERYDHTVFFGLSDENREGRWIWDDGTEDTLRLWSVKNGVQQPDNGNGYSVEHYAEFDYDRFNPEGSDNTGNWNDAAYLKNTSVFLCEWDYVLKGL